MYYKILLMVEEFCLGYEKNWLFVLFFFLINVGEIVGIIGKNGLGKLSLI